MEKTRHFIAKLVQMKPEDSKRRESYAVERRFYDHPDLADWFRVQHGLSMPKLVAGDRDGKAAYQNVCWIMNDLRDSFPIQVPSLSVMQAKAALSWLAKFHALGWKDEQHVAWKQSVLHARGGFWTIAPTAGQATINTQQLPSQWKTGLQKLVTEGWLEASDHSRLLKMGQRLQVLCQALPEFLHQQCKQYGTWIHGDFKAANMLFQETDKIDMEGDLSSCVGVVDFQFTGWGVCAEDVAYLLYPDAQGSLLEFVDELLDHYHEQLITNIMILMKGGPSSISREALTKLFDLSIIDMTRYWLSKGWEGTTEGEAHMILRMEQTVNAIADANGLGSKEDCLQALQSYL